MPSLKYIVLLHFAGISFGIQVDCPSKEGKHIPIPNTKYSIIQDPKDRSVDRVDRQLAAEQCKKCGLSLARVENMVQLALIGRNYEPLVSAHSIMDTWYWLDNTYNPTLDKYVYGDKATGTDVVKYNLFHYRAPRPTGVGAHITFKGEYVPEQNVSQCLTLALPYPHKERQQKEQSIYGHHTVFEERACESVKARHAMCQSDGKTYNNIEVKRQFNAFHLSEDKLDTYFNDGNWILGNRKYIMNWKHRTAKETQTYCESLGLKLFEPDTSVNYLIPHIKLFSRVITATQFWTSLIYDTITKQFYDSTGKPVDIKDRVQFDIPHGRKKRGSDKMEGQTNKKDHLFCVAIMVAYEFNEQMPCNDVLNPKCIWNFVQLVPGNCNNNHAALCQHEDKDARAIMWDPTYFKNVDQALKDTATKPFGYDSNVKVMRSTYKQTFGSLLCPEGFRMIREKDDTWYAKPKEEPKYHSYDYTETYWVVDSGEFTKNLDDTCTISVPKGDGFTREVKKVKCDEWHFYLCGRMNKPGKKAPTGQGPAERIKNKWAIGEFPRIYPLLEGKKRTIATEYRSVFPKDEDWVKID